ncbi:DNA repair protein RecO [Desulfothermus sp.]
MINREFFEHAIVLKVKTYRDNDFIVKFLTPSYGVVTAFAFGGRKSRRRFSGCFEELSHVVFKWKSPLRRGYFYLEEGILIDRFPNIHKDKIPYGIAVNCQKFIEAVVIGNSYSKGIYKIFLELLKELDKGNLIFSRNIPIFFRAQIASELGYKPQLESCNRCGRLLRSEQQIFFSPIKGQSFCVKCTEKKNGYLALNKRAYLFLKEVFYSGPRDLMNKESLTTNENIVVLGIQKFVETHLNIIWQKGKFVHL